MKMSSDFKQDIPVVKQLPGSYEWWYFDGRDHKGEYQFVVIFYEGCPFSSKYIRWQDKHPDHESAKASQYPAVSISVYQNGKTIYYAMSEYAPADAVFNRDRVSIRIGRNTLEGFFEDGHLVYSIKLDEVLPSGDRISGILRYISPEPNPMLFHREKKEDASENQNSHAWNLVQPLAQVKGVLSVSTVNTNEKPIIFEGVGYHDHNIGFEPMKNEFTDWYWGRIHFNDFTLVYYAMNKKGGTQHKAWLIGADNQLIIASARGLIADGKSSTFFGLRPARRLVFEFDSGRLAVDMNQVIDNGPFYMRFKSQARFETGEYKGEISYGLSEYIRPARIHNRFFWPLVHMRYRFAYQRPHWVQRSSTLYRWTW